VLVPTRELAVQVADSFASYGKHLRLTHTVIFGGVGQFPQVRALSRGVDIVIATPGRLLDLMEQGHVKLNRVEVLVLDEVDRMLDMGFARDMKLITAKLPTQRQSLLFSATLPPAIQEIASNLLQNPVRVEVTPLSTTAERIEQKVCHVSRSDKPKLLRHMLKEYSQGLVIVFARTKHGANRLAEDLHKDGIRADAIHGNKSQAARQKALENFRAGRARVLVATDVAARGIDVKGISLVINYDIPDEPESYVHRIGRTARAGAEGIAIAFCDPSERGSFRDVQRLIRQTIPVMEEHPFAISAPVEGQRGEQGGGAARPRRSFRGQPSGQNRFRGGSSTGGGGGGFNRRNDSRGASSSRPR
jgi:ATP-dependent RNA helicase RhlE